MITLYIALKILHLLAAALYLGVSLANGYAKTSADRTRDAAAIEFALDLVTRQNRVFIIPATVGLFATGLAMALLSGVPLLQGWLFVGLIVFALLCVFLAAAVWLEARLLVLARAANRASGQASDEYLRLSRIWSALGAVSMLAILVVVVVMTGRGALVSA